MEKGLVVEFWWWMAETKSMSGRAAGGGEWVKEGQDQTLASAAKCGGETLGPFYLHAPSYDVDLGQVSTAL